MKYIDYEDDFWEIVKEYEPEISDAHSNFRKVTKAQDTIGGKERELIKFGIACASGSKPAICSHAEECLMAGATKKEIFSVLINIMSMMGVTLCRQDTLYLQEFFKKK